MEIVCVLEYFVFFQLYSYSIELVHFHKTLEKVRFGKVNGYRTFWINMYIAIILITYKKY